MSTYGLTHAEVVTWIRTKCKEQGLSLAGLAANAGIERRTLSRYLSETRHHRQLSNVVQALGGKLLVEYDILEAAE